MDRRETIKSLLIGGVAGATILTTQVACKTDKATEEAVTSPSDLYGRTPEEKERDRKLLAEKFFTEHELETVAVLCDIILPANDEFGSASKAGVPAFIDFIALDMPKNQIPLRGGLMWLDGESNRRFDKEFKTCTNEEQIQIVEDIAYPEQDDTPEEMKPGVAFFDLMRNMTLTGYYTSPEGFKDLGYKGNVPTVWDGVPQEVLDKHGMAYDEEWLPKFVDQSKRDIQAEWDDQGNLLT